MILINYNTVFMKRNLLKWFTKVIRWLGFIKKTVICSASVRVNSGHLCEI